MKVEIDVGQFTVRAARTSGTLVLDGMSCSYIKDSISKY
jgi:hypothetical protein